MRKGNPSALPVVLVTGTSSGIGLALARLLFNEEQYRVVITARKTSLPKLMREPFVQAALTQAELRQSDRFLVRPLDVTSSREREALIDEINERWGGVDILINNAGISYRAIFEHMTDSDLEMQFQTNFLGPMGLIQLVLPRMRAKRKGHIINISSVGGMMAMPTMSAYSASKFALEGASESLWYEMKPWNVNVTLVQPGFIHSDSFKNVLYTDEAERSAHDKTDVYHAYYANMNSFIARMMNQAVATPDRIAQKLLLLMKKKSPPLRMPATIDALFFGLLRKFLPRELYHRLLYSNLPGIKNWVLPSTTTAIIKAAAPKIFPSSPPAPSALVADTPSTPQPDDQKDFLDQP